ncbi:hypothetical protein TGME49_233220 [Toxoplasma gondii ME49]|uniref:Transmembrane protein n=3 Tax=Toxoplasma gondii TaxID=5811 RepID=A0A125YRL1_TOXGV|nr:hypothetical protein TGME49_233220 [Toxoplasma gondii ME49]EPT28787.1 hypothetical protein TGME49_233220 [Toxoplasma gondii ME49]ESS35862.1 putative transmembrane protein [Toxoplasma gondii VEG]|eukprot:XP_018636788.1 hypothetical protein TGME49_233220 [Toxoplasma gondii ME49]
MEQSAGVRRFFSNLSFICTTVALLLLASAGLPISASAEAANENAAAGVWTQPSVSRELGPVLDVMRTALLRSANSSSATSLDKIQSDQMADTDVGVTLDSLRELTDSQERVAAADTAAILSSELDQFPAAHVVALSPRYRLLSSFTTNASVASSSGESGRLFSTTRKEGTTPRALRPKAEKSATVNQGEGQPTEFAIDATDDGHKLAPRRGTGSEARAGGAQGSEQRADASWELGAPPSSLNVESVLATPPAAAGVSHMHSMPGKGHPGVASLSGRAIEEQDVFRFSAENEAVDKPRHLRDDDVYAAFNETGEHHRSAEPSDASSGLSRPSGTPNPPNIILSGDASSTSGNSHSPAEASTGRRRHAGGGFPTSDDEIREWLITGAPFVPQVPAASINGPRLPITWSEGEGTEMWPESPDEESSSKTPGEMEDLGEVDQDSSAGDGGGDGDWDGVDEEAWPEGSGHEDQPTSGPASSFQALMKRRYRPYCQRLAADPRWQRQFGILVLSAVDWPLYTHKKHWKQPAIRTFFDALEQLTDDKGDDRLTGANVRYATQIRQCGFDAILRQQLEALRKTVNSMEEFASLVRAQRTVDVKLKDMLSYLPEYKLALVLTRATLGNLYQAVSQLQILYYYQADFKKEDATNVWHSMFRSERRVHWSLLQLLGVANQVVTPKPMHGIIILQVDKVESREKAVLELFDFVENEATQQALLKFESTVASSITMRIRKVARDFRRVLSFGWLSANADAFLSLPDCIVTAFYLKPGGANETTSVPPTRVRPAGSSNRRTRQGNSEDKGEIADSSAAGATADTQSVSVPVDMPETEVASSQRGRALSAVNTTPSGEDASSVTSFPAVTVDPRAAFAVDSSSADKGSSPSNSSGSKRTPIEIGQFGFEMEATIAQKLKEKLPPGSMYIQLSLADAWDFQPESRLSGQTNVIPSYSATQILKANLGWDPSLVGVGMARVVYSTITDPYSSSLADKGKHDEYDNDRNLIIRVPNALFRGEENFLDEVMSMIVVPSVQDSASRTVAPDRLKVMGAARRLTVGDVLKTGMFGVGIPYSQHRVIESMVDPDSVCVHLLVKGLRERTRENSLELPGVAIFDRFARRSRGRYMLVFVDVVPKKTAAPIHTQNQAVRQGGYPSWVLLLSNICVALFFIFVIVCLLLNHYVKLPWWVACICGSHNPFIREPEYMPSRTQLGSLSSSVSTLAPGASVRVSSTGNLSKGGYFSDDVRKGSSAARAERHAARRSSRERASVQTRSDSGVHPGGATGVRRPVDDRFVKGGSPVVLEPIQPAGDNFCGDQKHLFESYKSGDTPLSVEPPRVSTVSPTTSVSGDRGERKQNSVLETPDVSQTRGASHTGEGRSHSDEKFRRDSTRNLRQTAPNLAVSDSEYMACVASANRDSRASWGRGSGSGYAGDRHLSSRASQSGLEQLKALEIARAYRENRNDLAKSMERRRASRRSADASGTQGSAMPHD